MNQFIGFCILLGGLFGIATMLLWRLPWPKREPWRTLVEGLIVVVDLAVALWLNRHFSQYSYELIATTIACSHFAFVCFWCITSRGPAVLRIGLFAIVVAAMFALYFIPPERFMPSRDAMGTERIAIPRSAIRVQVLTQRLIITCVATWVAGVACRARGWRLELVSDSSLEKQSVESSRFIAALVGLAIAIPVVVWVHAFVVNNWTNVFNRDFSIAALGSFYGALLIVVLALTACRFHPIWNKISIVVVTVLVAWLLYSLEDKRYDSFASPRYGPTDWGQYARWLVIGTLWWWLVWKHLAGTGFQLAKTDEPLLKRPKLRHVMVAMVIMAVLFSSVKSRYFDRFDDLIRREHVYCQPSVGPIETTTFSGAVSDRVVSKIGRLTKLRRVGFHQTTVEPQVMSQILRLRKLQALAFVECGFTAKCLSGIESLDGLESLQLIETPINSDDLSAISKIPNLRHVALSDFADVLRLGALGSIEHLDLTRCKALDPAALLDLNMRNLKRIDFPQYVNNVAFKSVPSPSAFPKLEKLTIELAEITPVEIEQINRLSSLKTVELVGCRTGFELLEDLDLEELSLRYCKLSQAELSGLARFDESITLKIFGVASDKEIEAEIGSYIAVANHFDAIDMNVGQLNAPANLAAVAPMWPNPPPFMDDPWGFGIGMIAGDEGLKLKTDGECRLPPLTISFENLLAILPVGRFEFGDPLEVVDGDRKKSSNPSGLIFSLPVFGKLSADEVSRLLKAAKHQVNLSLIDPQLENRHEKLFAESKLQQVSLTFREKPKDLRESLRVLNPSKIYVRVQLINQSMDEATQRKIENEFGGRVTITNVRMP